MQRHSCCCEVGLGAPRNVRGARSLGRSAVRMLSRARVIALLATAPLVTACGRGSSDSVTVGSKNFTEELILGELYARVLEHAGIAVTRKLNLGTTDIAMAALKRGEIDLYPEYTVTALLNVLHLPPESDPQRAYRTVEDAYAQQFGLVWLD